MFFVFFERLVYFLSFFAHRELFFPRFFISRHLQFISFRAAAQHADFVSFVIHLCYHLSSWFYYSFPLCTNKRFYLFSFRFILTSSPNRSVRKHIIYTTHFLIYVSDFMYSITYSCVCMYVRVYICIIIAISKMIRNFYCTTWWFSWTASISSQNYSCLYYFILHWYVPSPKGFNDTNTSDTTKC